MTHLPKPGGPVEDIADDVPGPEPGARFHKPSRLALFMEGRAAFEAGSFFAAWPLLARSPRGDGRPVLLLPGFLVGDGSMFVLKQFLRQMGYAASGWLQGRNLGPSQELLGRLSAHLTGLFEADRRKVVLIGQSLGGVYARELARLHPAMVAQVITLGSPFRMPSAAGISQLFGSSGEIDAQFEALRGQLSVPPPVPVTALYSRTDGIVPWQTCVESPGDNRQSIEIYSSHCGMALNPGAVTVIMDRLALADGLWRPYRPAGLLSLWFPLRRKPVDHEH